MPRPRTEFRIRVDQDDLAALREVAERIEKAAESLWLAAEAAGVEVPRSDGSDDTEG